MRAIWPQIHWGKNRLAPLCPEVERSRLWSATPFGEADIITLPATPDRLNAYPLVITTGDLALDDTGLDRLEAYAHGGRQVLLFAADVAAPSRLAAYCHTAMEADRWRRSWGAGSIHLVDLPEHRYEAEQAHRRLRAVQDLVAALPVVWRLEPNRHIHVQK